MGRATEPTVVVDDLHVIYRVYGGAQPRDVAGAGIGRVLGRGGGRRPALRQVNAIRGISMVACRGDVIGVVGANGAGKSTLLRAIAGLQPPSRGRVYARGRPCLMGVQAALMKDLTGARNIVLGCLAMGMTPRQVDETYDAVVEFSGLGRFIDLPMRAYSTGMAQRLRFAIATTIPHDVMLIDEALATGDAAFRRRSAERLAELREQAATVFLVSHGLETISETCNRAIWLDDGQVRMDGSPAAVIAAYREATGVGA
jgi:teichoic acid transport system ATP-binding protein